MAAYDETGPVAADLPFHGQFLWLCPVPELSRMWHMPENVENTGVHLSALQSCGSLDFYIFYIR